MTTRTDPKTRRTAIVPVTTMEELPVLSTTDRASLATSLAEAEARIKAGKFVDCDPDSFRGRLMQSYKAAKHAKSA